MATLRSCLLVLIAALVKPVHELNVNALRSFIFLTVRRHHKFKEIGFRLFVIRPDLSFAVADGSDLA